MSMTLKELVQACELLVETNAAITVEEAALKLVKDKARTLREETIPNAMIELGLTSLTLDNGQKVTIAQAVYASIPADQAAAAFEWLNKNGFGGLIKTEVIIAYGKGDRELAYAYSTELCKKGINATFKENVHPQTLKAFLKEQIRDAKPVPMELFGARPVMTAKIK